MISSVIDSHREPVSLLHRNNALSKKLSVFAPLSSSDRRILHHAADHEECFPADVDIVAEGMSPRSVFWIKEGMAIRYRALPNGSRQIITFLIPGDLCDEHVFLIKAMDHSIATITPVRVAAISRENMMEMFLHRPRIAAALWWSSLQEQAMLRERIVALGRRDARGRLAYLLCELLWRHAAVGLADENRFPLPLTQIELGDTLGLTPVHINRILKEFRQDSLIMLDQKVLSILNVPILQQIAGLGDGYLQLSGASAELSRYFDSLESRERINDNNT